MGSRAMPSTSRIAALADNPENLRENPPLTLNPNLMP
jgi:hypothetical protein